VEKHAERLDSNREQVLAEWRQRVRTMERSESLDTPTLNNHIPSLLEAICVSLRQQRALSPEEMNMSASKVHGLQRTWTGLDIVEVVAEYNALRAVLLDFYERQCLSLAGDSAHVVNDVIDTAIALAMKSYAGEKVAELQRFRSERLSFVTHDLKTPLSAIHAAAHVLETRINSLDEKTQRKMLGVIQRNIIRMDTLITKVLQEERTTEINAGIEPREIDLWPLIQSLIRDMLPLAEGDGTAIHNLVGEDVVVFADPRVLTQIFQNLLSNALKYTHAGQIAVTAEILDNGIVECVMTDNGEGIPAERLGKIFDKFESDPAHEGTGLGLAIVKQAVEAHGGHITVESRFGEGTSFRFTLPGVTESNTKDSQTTDQSRSKASV
jgi:two-component system, OmpR family, phosphate regulon sensor histidine kinase PhoR